MRKGIVARPIAVSRFSGYSPARVDALIVTSANRYVPFSLTETLETLSAGLAEFTRAPLRFVPRTKSLTGLIE
jgi:hypothetical protein